MSGILPKHITQGPYLRRDASETRVCVDVYFHRAEFSVWLSPDHPNACFAVWDSAMGKPIPMQPKLWASLLATTA